MKCSPQMELDYNSKHSSFMLTALCENAGLLMNKGRKQDSLSTSCCSAQHTGFSQGNGPFHNACRWFDCGLR